MRGVKLREDNLIRTDFRGADLRAADLRGAQMERTDLREANVIYADLRGAKGLSELQKMDLRRRAPWWS